jgi:hypothetical protein
MTMTTASPLAPPRSFKHLTAEEMAERQCSELCFNCDEPFMRGHKCKHLFHIMAVNDYNSNDNDTDIDNNLLMMIGTNHSLVQGRPPMHLTGVVSGMGVHILIYMGAMHNIIDINFTHLIGLQEQRINTAILVGSGNEVPYRATAFGVPLRIDADIFYIDAYLVDISNDVDIILGTPWLAGLGRLTWDFTTVRLQYICNGRPFTFTTA